MKPEETELIVGEVSPRPMEQGDREWLKWPAPDNRDPIRATSTSYRRGTANNQITLSGLTDRELDAVQQFLLGLSYLGCFKGRLHAYSVTEPLPKAEDDPLLAPHWESDGTMKEYGGRPVGEGSHSPGIIIEHVGAGARSRRETESSKATLTACGFTCLRSPRGDDGRFWEQWVLHGLWQAKGPFEKYLKALEINDWHREAEVAARFIARDLNVKFGSLDITIQRWALCND